MSHPFLSAEQPPVDTDPRAEARERALDLSIQEAYRKEKLAFLEWSTKTQFYKDELAKLLQDEDLPRPWLAEISSPNTRNVIAELEKAGLYDGDFLADLFPEARDILTSTNLNTTSTAA